MPIGLLLLLLIMTATSLILVCNGVESLQDYLRGGTLPWRIQVRLRSTGFLAFGLLEKPIEMRKPLGNSGDKARFASKVSDLRSWHHWETTIARDKFPLIMPSVDAGEFGRVQLVRSMNTPQLLHRLDHVLQGARIASLRWHEAFDLGATAATATSGSIFLHLVGSPRQLEADHSSGLRRCRACSSSASTD